MFWALDLKSGDPEFKSLKLDLSQVIPGSTPQLGLCIAHCWLGFLACKVYFSSLYHWALVCSMGH